MSARYSAWIRIGGRLDRSRAGVLLKAVNEAGASLEWGDAPFEPSSTEELIQALQDDWLFLCDEQAAYGEFPELEETCRRLGLSYTRHTEAFCDCDAELVDWRPGMAEPLVRVGSNVDPAKTFIAADTVKAVRICLENGKVQQAMDMLRDLCPEVSDLPHFELI